MAKLEHKLHCSLIKVNDVACVIVGVMAI